MTKILKSPKIPFSDECVLSNNDFEWQSVDLGIFYKGERQSISAAKLRIPWRLFESQWEVSSWAWFLILLHLRHNPTNWDRWSNFEQIIRPIISVWFALLMTTRLPKIEKIPFARREKEIINLFIISSPLGRCSHPSIGLLFVTLPWPALLESVFGMLQSKGSKEIPKT